MKSYHYLEEGKITDNLFIKKMNASEMKKVNGGKSHFNIFLHHNYSRLSDNNFVK